MDLLVEAKGNQPGGPGPKEQKGHSGTMGQGQDGVGPIPARHQPWPSHDSPFPWKAPSGFPLPLPAAGVPRTQAGQPPDKLRGHTGCVGLGPRRHSCQKLAASELETRASAPQEKGRPHCKGQAVTAGADR